MKKIRLILFFLAMSLFSMNIAGLFISLRNPAIYGEPGNFFENDITLTEDELVSIIEKATPECRRTLLIELTDAVNRGIAHYWKDEGIEKYNLRVPFYENYLLFLASYLYPEKFRKYEFADYKKAMERGVGECSQESIILYEILKRKGVEAAIIGLRGHVVVMALVDEIAGLWWILDPDYGAVIEHGIDEIEKNPGLIKDPYADKGYNIEIIHSIMGVYKRAGNQIHRGTADYLETMVPLEVISYLLIWLIPCALAAPLVVHVIKRRFGSPTKDTKTTK